VSQTCLAEAPRPDCCTNHCNNVWLNSPFIPSGVFLLQLALYYPVQNYLRCLDPKNYPDWMSWGFW